MPQQKGRQQGRAIARLDRRPAGGSEAEVVTSDPVTVGPNRTINVDMAKMPTPTNLYDADYAWLEHSAGKVSLFFGKRNRDEPGKLRTRLELRYPPENLVGHFWRNSRDFHVRLREYAEKWPPDAERAAVDPSGMAAAKDHSDWANFDGIAHAGTEASIDFYQMPASGIARYMRGGGSSGLKFNPVVRVQLTIFELLRLLDSASAVVESINRYLPQSEHQGAEDEGKQHEEGS